MLILSIDTLIDLYLNNDPPLVQTSSSEKLEDEDVKCLLESASAAQHKSAENFMKILESSIERVLIEVHKHIRLQLRRTYHFHRCSTGSTFCTEKKGPSADNIHELGRHCVTLKEVFTRKALVLAAFNQVLTSQNVSDFGICWLRPYHSLLGSSYWCLFKNNPTR